MQTNFTYEQFEEAAKKNNLLGQFSQADLNLARRNPDAGMELLNYKTDYRNATTDEGRALAQSGAEGIRKQYGGYSGGEDGSGFYMTGNTPTAGSFTYTSEDVFQKARDGGVYDQLSPEDIQLIQSSPDFGMGVVSGKIQHNNATTDEERTAARSMTENQRMLGGGYTTNADGSGYYKAMPSPDDFTYEEAPKWADSYGGDVDALWDKKKNYGDFSYDVEKPTYKSKYGDTVDELAADILNREAFSYDAESDPLYGQYKKQYTREGRRATEDTMGAAAAMTGGIPSSYAATAAAQAGNYYAAQLTDKIPELYQMAYNQYMNEHNMKLAELDAIRLLNDTEYSRYRDDVEDWKGDRNFAYGVYGDKYNRIGDDLQTARELQQTDYNRYNDEHDKWDTNRDFEYGQFLDEVTHQKDAEQTAYNRAFNERAYKDGRDDVIFANNLALREMKNAEESTKWNQDFAEKELSENISSAEWETLITLAAMQAEAGNPELLNRIGKERFGENWEALDTSAFQNKGGKSGGGGNGEGNQGYGATGTPDITAGLAEIYPNGVVYNEDEWEVIVGEIFGGSEKEANAAGFRKGNILENVANGATTFLGGIVDKTRNLIGG